MALPKSRPWETENKKLTQAATFLRLRIVAGLLNTNNAVKAQQITCLAAHFRLLRDRQGSAIAKKLQKEQNFCFHNRQIAVTGARSHEKRVNSPSEGKGQTLQRSKKANRTKPHEPARLTGQTLRKTLLPPATTTEQTPVKTTRPDNSNRANLKLYTKKVRRFSADFFKKIINYTSEASHSTMQLFRNGLESGASALTIRNFASPSAVFQTSVRKRTPGRTGEVKRHLKRVIASG